MKRTIYLILSLFACFLLQTALVNVFSDKVLFLPYLTLVFIVALAFNESFVKLLWLGFLAGFLMELFSGFYFGAHIFAYVLVACGVYFVTSSLLARESNFPISLSIVSLSSLAYIGLVFTYEYAAATFNLVDFPLLGEIFRWSLLLNIFANLVVFFPIRKYLSWLNDEEGSL